MTFIKYLQRTSEREPALQKRKETGQGMLEYSLLVIVAIIALLASSLLSNSGNAFENFFRTAAGYITTGH